MAIITYSDLSPLRKKFSGKKVVFVSGSFDIPHAGHVFFFEESKKHGDALFVTVGRDAEIKKNKGADRPIMNESVRLKMVDSLRAVDYVFLTNRPPEGAGWLVPIEEIFEALRPDVYVVNSDVGDISERQKTADKFGIKMVVLGMDFPSKRDKLSTTRIIEKIKGLTKRP